MTFRLETALICVLLVVAPSVVAPARAAGDPDDVPTLATKAGADGRSPRSDGAVYRDATPIEAAEWKSPHPGYAWLLQRIAAGTADKRIMRQHYWLHFRLEPFDKPIPADWRARARARLLATEGAPQKASATALLPAVGRWVPVGPYTIPGRVTGLSRPAGRPGWILAAMADGGLWLTRDAGAHWDPLTDREATQASGAALGDPVDGSVLYWGTGEGNGAIDNYGGYGVMRSVDRGRTWLVSNNFSGTVRCLAEDRTARGTIWACGNDGAYRTTDSGATFTKLPGLPNNGASAIAIRPDRPSTIFVGLWGGGVWRSTDGGTSFTQLAGGLPANIGRVDLALCAANPDVMVAASELNNGDLWKSTDGGTTWAALSAAPDACGGQCWYDLVAAIAPDDCNTIYWAGVGAYVSRDGGASFAQMPTSGTGSAGWDFHAALTGTGGEIVLGGDAGVFRSLDHGATFAARSDNLPTTQYYGGCGHNTDPSWIAGGTQDNGTDQSATTQAWRYILGGDGGKCVASNNQVFAEYQVTNVQRSLDGGNSFGDANGGIGSNDPKAWVGIMAKDPLDARTAYVGTSSVYRTTNFHDTAWVKVMNPLYYGRLVTSMAVSPVDRNVLWVGFDYGGLYRTANALATPPAWKAIKGSSWPLRAVTRVTPHPSNANAAWIVQGGYGYPKIWSTVDAGTTYTDVTGDLPDLPVTDLVVDPGDTNVLIAGTDLAIWRSSDGGAHWTNFSDGLPYVAIADLFRHPAAGDLVAATHGRSFYRFRAAAAGAVAVPDGKTVPGKELVAERTASGALWLRWDSAACTAADYNLFWGPLAGVAQATYGGAVCGLGRTGEKVIAMPGTAGDSLFFVVAGASAEGVEGPHGYRSDGSPSGGTGVGSCGVTVHQAAATCP